MLQRWYYHLPQPSENTLSSSLHHANVVWIRLRLCFLLIAVHFSFQEVTPVLKYHMPFSFCDAPLLEGLSLQISPKTPPIPSCHKKVLQEKTSRRWKLALCWRLLHIPICHAHSTQLLKTTRASLSPQIIYLIWQANFLLIIRFGEFISPLGRVVIEK